MTLNGVLTPELLFVALIALAAGFTQGLTGFGFALVAAPFLLLVMEPKEVVITNILLAVVPSLLIVVHGWRKIKFRGILPILLASGAGTPLGVYVLQVIDPSVLKLTIAIMVVASSLPMLLGRTFRIRGELRASLFVGFLSGFLTASTSLGGPPVVLFAISQGWPKEVLRASLSAFFLFKNVFVLTALWISGALSNFSPETGLVAPLPVVGVLLATLVLPHVKPELFRKIVILVVMGSGLVAAAQEALRLL